MGSDVGQIFPTASLHRDHSISYALVCEKEISYMRDSLSYISYMGKGGRKMCLAQGPQRSDAGEARTRGPSVSSQALYH